MEQFLQLVQDSGLEGLIIGVAVLTLVYGLNRSGVVVSKAQKQFANVSLSILLSGLSLLDPNISDAVTASFASLGSALMYEGLRWLVSSRTV